MLNNEHLKQLKKTFDASEHSFRVGSGGAKFAYVTEQAISNRLDDVDPAWTFEIVSIVNRADTITVHGRLTVQGVIRENTGMSSIDTATNKKPVMSLRPMKRKRRPRPTP